MTNLEGIIGLIASSCAIIGAIILVGRYVARRFDRWIDAVVENSGVIRGLSTRITTLEETINKNGRD
jgi:hypothetical protein